MNRQQIEAWLVLEGYVPFSGGTTMNGIRHKGYLRVGIRRYYYVVGAYETVMRWRDADEEWAQKSIASFGGKREANLTDEQLQLIYQEIIKHEKD